MAKDQREDPLQPGVGAESGTNRSPAYHQKSPGHHNTAPEQEAHVGSVATRTPSGTNEAIGNRSVAEEDGRQEGVVEDRPDAQAGLNANRRKTA